MTPIFGAVDGRLLISLAAVAIVLVVVVAKSAFPSRMESRRRAVRPYLETYTMLRDSGKSPEEAREAMVRAHSPGDAAFVGAALERFALVVRRGETERRSLAKAAVALSILLEGDPPSLAELRREMAEEVGGYGLPGDPVKSHPDSTHADGFDGDIDFDGD